MQDKYGRKIEYLRLSVTQNCNLKCIYCMPDDKGKETCNCESLTPDEIEKVVSVLASLGIKKVRITGGEPLLRPDICEIIKRVAGIGGIEDISLTTNGIRLAALAGDLKAAGLMRVNISLDSLKPEVFKKITGGGRVEDVLDGIQKALDVGLRPVKTNTVLIKGINDNEIDDFILLAKEQPVDVRFIELMPIGRFGEENTGRIIPSSDIIAAHPELEYLGSDSSGQPARYYGIEGYKGRIGFISPMSHKFCNDCNRIRLTCDGKLKLCLGNNGECDLVGLLHDSPEKLAEALKKAIYEKPAGHNFKKGFASEKGMNQIGG